MKAEPQRKAMRTTIIALIVGICSLLSFATPATASSTQSFTYEGVTYTWSKADFSDLSISSTPSTSDRLPAGVTSNDVRKADQGRNIKSSSNIRLLGAAAPAGTDHCTNSPDKYLWVGADYRPACDAHDACYSPSSRRNRADCDKDLLLNITKACFKAYGSLDPRRYTCTSHAEIYYGFVRTLGKSHYHGKGNPS